LAFSLANYRSDDGIEARAIAAASQYSDSHVVTLYVCMTYVLTKCWIKVRTSVRELIIVLVMAKTIIRKATEATLKREVKDMRKVLADRLFELRTDADLSQAKLAEIAGVDRKTINRIENGHFSPALDTIVRLSVALGITPSALLAN
jgi:DNA-binding XRE family transcriptional regulator